MVFINARLEDSRGTHALLAATAQRTLDDAAIGYELASAAQPSENGWMQSRHASSSHANLVARSLPILGRSSSAASVWDAVVGYPVSSHYAPSSLTEKLLLRQSQAAVRQQYATRLPRPASAAQPGHMGRMPTRSSQGKAKDLSLSSDGNRPQLGLQRAHRLVVSVSKTRSPSRSPSRFKRTLTKDKTHFPASPGNDPSSPQRAVHHEKYMAPMTMLAYDAATVPHLLQAEAFDRRQIGHRRRVGTVLNALEADVTSLSKASAFRRSTIVLERNRYVEPHVLETTTAYKAKQKKPPPPPKPIEVEEWSLDKSIWAPRKEWSDSLHYYDTDEVERQKFERIWQAARVEQGLDKLITRNDDDGTADLDGDGTPDEVTEVGDVLWDFHDLLFCLFDYYCALGTNLGSMAFNNWSDFLTTCKLVSKKSKFCKKADMDRLFIAVDSRLGKASKSLNHVEFLAALVHLSINKYILPGILKDASEAMFKLLNDDIEANLDPRCFEEANSFRKEFCCACYAANPEAVSNIVPPPYL